MQTFPTQPRPRPGTAQARPWVTASLLLAIGAALGLGGAMLVRYGGSWGYLLTGAAVAASGVLLLRRSVWGLRLFWAMLIAQWAWAFAEVGFAPWPLVPRLLGPTLVGAWLLTPWPRRALGLQAAPAAALACGAAAASSLALAAFVASPPIPPPLARIVDAGAAAGPAPTPRALEWAAWGHTLSGARHSPAAQITPANVRDLEPVWRFDTGAIGNTFEPSPIEVDGVLYFCTDLNVLFALDAETGELAWRFDPKADNTLNMHAACRGVTYVETAQAGACARRIYTATIDARLIAVDAATGARCAGFGKDGEVSLLEGLGAHPKGYYYPTSPPLAVRGKLIQGAFVLDNRGVGAPSGVVRAYDAVTGALAWAWDMGRLDSAAPLGEGETYTPATPNAWGLFSADEALGLVYVPLGNPSPDFFAGRRRPFDEAYGSSVVALDVGTGRPVWSYQTTHHDLWDYDLSAQPVLVDLPAPGGPRPALVESTKRGDIFVLDRRTGEPILPVTEEAVNQGAVEGDTTAPTQPRSSLTLMPPPLREADMWGLTTFDLLFCRIKFSRMRYHGAFTPPGIRETIQFPGPLGGIDWGGVTIDEARGILVANANFMPYSGRLMPRAEAPAERQAESDWRDYVWGPQTGTPYVSWNAPYLSVTRAPCVAPPWGVLAAFDLVDGRMIWKRPLGLARDMGPFGLHSGLPFTIGTPTVGGAITTASGLTFVAASTDRSLRAFETATGKLLWRADLPAHGHAVPVTYVSRSGRQYVVIAAGGNPTLGGKPAVNELVAFALPEARP